MFAKKKEESTHFNIFNEEQLGNLFLDKIYKEEQDTKLSKLLFDQNILLKRLFEEINQKSPNDKENSQFDNLKKKLFAIEKNWISGDENRKKNRRNSAQMEVDKSILVLGPDIQQEDLKQLQKQVQKQQEKCSEFIDKYDSSMIDNQIEKLAKEREILLEQKNELVEEEKKIKLKQTELDKKEININKTQLEILVKKKKIQEQKNQQNIDQNNYENRKKNLENVQKKLNDTMNQLLLLNNSDLKRKVKAELGLPLEAIEELVTSTFKERSLIQEQKQYYFQIKEALREEKRKQLN